MKIKSKYPWKSTELYRNCWKIYFLEVGWLTFVATSTQDSDDGEILINEVKIFDQLKFFNPPITFSELDEKVDMAMDVIFSEWLTMKSKNI